jgi:undecaprenyl-diphosphatase
LTLWQALGLGVLQGVTEFLPISSSGHLVLAQNLWPGLEGSFFLFDVVVHLGTILAILWVMRGRVAGLCSALLALLVRRAGANRTDVRWIGLILLASVPTVLIGFALRDIVEGMQTRVAGVGAALLVTAALLYAAERWGQRSRGASELGWIDAVLVGTAQGLSVIPGISRSGATVAAALYRDSRAEVAVEFSMLISIPAVIGANLLEAGHAGLAGLSAESVPLLVGFVAAFVTGALSLRALQWVVTRRMLLPFGAYCLVVGLGAVALG